MKYSNDENKKLAQWLRRTLDGKQILATVKNPIELELACYNYAKKKGSIAGMEYTDKDEETDDGLNWVTFSELFDELGLKPVKKKKTAKKKRIVKYYLGGDEWVRVYGDEDFSLVLVRAKRDGDFTLATHTMGDDPDSLLGQLDGCCGCVEILKNEYEQLKAIEDENNKPKITVFEILKKRYLDAENVSGEFVLGERFVKSEYTHSEMIKGVQSFLNWDDSDQEFTVEQEENEWVIKEA